MSTGRPSLEELLTTAELFNRAFFGAVLRPVIHWRRMRNYGECHEPNGRYPYGLIVLSTMLPKCARWDEVLLHEMVHCFLDTMYPNMDEYDKGRLAYHGPMFASECNRIAHFLGLPMIDEEHSWGWPMCLRSDYNWEPAREE